MMRFALVVCLALSCTLAAAASNEDRFRAAYEAYQTHLAANETKEALAAARKAFQIGTKLFGDKSANTANLASNYAALLNDVGEQKKARKALLGKLEVLEARYGDGIELVPMLVELGRAHLDDKISSQALGYFNRAATLAEQHESAIYAGQKNFDIAKALLQQRLFAASEPFMTRAHEIFVAQLEPEDLRRVLTSYQMATWATARGQHADAVQHLQGTLVAFASNDGQLSDLERTVRYRLVDAHERLGDREAATEHCLAIGARQAWSAPPAPVYRVQATYPTQALERKLSGEVRLTFTIDANGYVTDAAVAESSDAVFDEAALTMIKQYRYAPRFVDGAAVATSGIEIHAVFDLAVQTAGAFKGDFRRPALPGFPEPSPYDPSVCGDPNDPSVAGRCEGFAGRKTRK